MSTTQDIKAPAAAPPYEMQPSPAPEAQYIQQQPQMQQVQPGQMDPAQPGAVHMMPQQPIGVYQPAMPGQFIVPTIPINTLSRNSAPVVCPACQTQGMTRVTFESGKTTHVWACVLCLCACVGCIPYLMESLKNVNHHCSNCGVLLATWHRSGSLKVHEQGVQPRV